MQRNRTTRNRNSRGKASSTTDSNSSRALEATGEDYSSRLPNEMVSSIFELFSQPDLLRVARVCHRWRAVARLLPTFYAHLVLKAEELDSVRAYRQTLERYSRQLRAAAGAGFRLSLRVNVRWDGDVESDYSGALHGATSRDPYDLDEVMPKLVHETVIRAFREYLASIVKLHVSLSQDCFHDLQQSLALPAPELRSLVLDFLGDSDVELSAINLFGGHAPKLTALRLTSVDLCGNAPIPALSAVCSLRLYGYTDSIIASIATNFPALKHLTIDDLEPAVEDDKDVSLAPCRALETLVVTFPYMERGPGLPVAFEAFLNAQSIPRIYSRLYYDYDGDIDIAVGSLFSRFKGPVHLSLYYLDGTEKKAVPQPLLPDPSLLPDTHGPYVIELHSVANKTHLTLLIDNPPAVARIASSIHSNSITELNVGFHETEFIADEFRSLPQLSTLRVRLDVGTTGNSYGHEITVFDDDEPVLECPRLDQVVIYAPALYGLEQLQTIQAVLRDFVPTHSARPLPILVLQGDPLPELVASPLLLSRVRAIIVEPMHTFCEMAGCCSTAPVSAPSA